MKKLNIWEYICCVVAIITILFAMALVSADKLTMKESLKISYFATFPFIVVQTTFKKGKHFIYLILYLLLIFLLLK